MLCTPWQSMHVGTSGLPVAGQCCAMHAALVGLVDGAVAASASLRNVRAAPPAAALPVWRSVSLCCSCGLWQSVHTAAFIIASRHAPSDARCPGHCCTVPRGSCSQAVYSSSVTARRDSPLEFRMRECLDVRVAVHAGDILLAVHAFPEALTADGQGQDRSVCPAGGSCLAASGSRCSSRWRV